MDVFCQNDIPSPPSSRTPWRLLTALCRERAADRVCRVVRAMKRMTVGAIGARTSAFKTVRIDELTLQHHGITMETFDLSDLFARMRAIEEGSDAFKAKAECLQAYTDFAAVPADRTATIIRMAVALDNLIEEARLDALALRCWVEMQQQLGISPCVILSELNNRGFPAACEVDVGNALAMHALSRASGDVATCLDWNNNYGDDDDKCILFHCGPVPQSMMTAPRPRGRPCHPCQLRRQGCGFGCNVGRIKRCRSPLAA